LIVKEEFVNPYEEGERLNIVKLFRRTDLVTGLTQEGTSRVKN
jgi:hypothetical protein